MTDTQRVMEHLAGDEAAALERLKAFLTIPSVSTDRAYAVSIVQAAQWVAGQLREIGLRAAVHGTGGSPVVLAHTPAEMVANAQSPRVLFYGHYDVQPPDPVEGWETPAFEPTVREGAVYARGSCDDKGQVSCFFEALRAWKVATGKLPCAVTVLIEGEEECGSVHFEPFLKAHARELAADIVVISDTSMWDAHTPAITYALRGLLYYDIKLYGPNRDLHSGVFGGALANPATMLTRVLGKLFDESQRVTIPGFYDDVMVVDEEQIEQWSKLDFDEKRFLGSVGVDRPFGENGYSTLERRWARPSCDVNGLYGGYMGEGAKTVIPSFAGAKVSFRLVANQDPVKIAAAFEQWLQEQETGGCRWQLTHHGGASPVAMPTDSPYIAAAKAAIKATAGINPVLVRDGATIPVVASFKKHLGVDSLMVGFGLEGDKIHSPNEHFALERFYLGCRTHAVMLREMGIMKRE